MKLNLYHKVLAKLFEVTGGRDSQIVDLKDLVKNQGFLGSYQDIFQFLSVQSWIMETSKADYVRMTHWGIKEAKRILSDEPDVAEKLKKQADQLLYKTKELLNAIEEFKTDTSTANFNQLEKNIEELKSISAVLKNRL